MKEFASFQELFEKALAVREEKGKAEEVRFDEIIPDEEVILTFNRTNILSRGNVLTIIAPPGTGKSNICQSICAACVAVEESDYLGFECQVQDADVLYCDTEQTAGQTHRGLKRIFHRAFPASSLNGHKKLANLEMIRMRKMTTSEGRKQAIEEYILKRSRALLLVDGIADLVADVNSSEEAQRIAWWLMNMAETHNIGIIVTIHDNPNKMAAGKARGHLGSELMRRSEAVMILQKVKGDEDMRKITLNFDYGKVREGGLPHDTYILWDKERSMFVSVSDDGRATRLKEKQFAETEYMIAGILKGVPFLPRPKVIEEIMRINDCSKRTAERKFNTAMSWHIISNVPGGIRLVNNE